MRKVILACFVLMLMVCPAWVHAQGAPTLAVVHISLWPEFDRPTMLVIYRIVLDTRVRLPTEMTFRIPSVAGAPNAVAARQPNDMLVSIPYTQRKEGEWLHITLQALTPELQIEYYDPRLKKEGVNRHFDYVWPGDYAVQDVFIEVQQPFGASEMRISPSLGVGKAGADGLIYFTSEIGSLAANQSFTLSLDYQKKDDNLSSDLMGVEPSGPLGEDAWGRLNVISAMPYVLGALGLFLIGGGAYWYWRSGQEKGEAKAQQRRTKRNEKEQMAEAQDVSVYCHQCGKRALPGDRFCRVCGTPLMKG